MKNSVVREDEECQNRQGSGGAKRRRFNVEKESTSHQNKQPSLESLPDEILVNIGKFVGSLCGAHDFVRFSRVSKRFRKLMMKKDIIDHVILAGKTRMEDERSSHQMCSMSKSPYNVTTLEQVALYESVVEHNVLENNHIHFALDKEHSIPRLEYWHYSIDWESGARSVINAVQSITSRYPAVEVMLEDHHGHIFPPPWGGDRLVDIVEKEFQKLDRELGANYFRSWDAQIFNDLESSADYARLGFAWVEIYFVMQGTDSHAEPLLLPPIPDFYEGYKFKGILH